MRRRDEEERKAVACTAECRHPPMHRCHASQHTAMVAFCCVNLVQGFFFPCQEIHGHFCSTCSIGPLWVSCYSAQEETRIGSDTGEHEIECTTTALDETRARRVYRVVVVGFGSGNPCSRCISLC